MMNTSQLVILAGAAILGVLVGLLLRPRIRGARRLAESPEVQEVFLAIQQGGFVPETIVLQRGIATKIRLQRDTDDSSSDIVVFPKWSLERTLPAFKTTTIDLQPDDPGVFDFHSKDERLRGRIVVEDK